MKRIILRALTSTDIKETLKWHNQDDIADFYSGHPFPINEEMEKRWYDKILFSNYPNTIFGIEHIVDQRLIGISMLKDINMINRVAEFAIYLGNNQYRGKGLAKEATIETLRFAFYKLGLNRIFLKVIEDNIVAISLYESVGFVKEGVLIQSVFKNNSFKNEVIFRMLKGELNV